MKSLIRKLLELGGVIVVGGIALLGFSLLFILLALLDTVKWSAFGYFVREWVPALLADAIYLAYPWLWLIRIWNNYN